MQRMIEKRAVSSPDDVTEGVSVADTAEFVADMSAQLAVMARRAGLGAAALSLEDARACALAALRSPVK